MNDIDRFRELFASFGITVPKPAIDAETGESEFTFEADTQPRVGGYSGFIGKFTFNQDGSFKRLSFWR
jgi:hypothetical protein